MQRENSTPPHREPQVVKRGGSPADVRANRQLSRAFYILKSAGHGGVNRERFLTSIENGGFGITQIATRIFELRKLGCVIDSCRANPSHAFVTYRLVFAPADIEERLDRRQGYNAPKKSTGDWYIDATGKGRPASDLGPLFSSGGGLK
jgi:hypothetical protein